jgi:hypothetical protein
MTNKNSDVIGCYKKIVGGYTSWLEIIKTKKNITIKQCGQSVTDTYVGDIVCIERNFVDTGPESFLHTRDAKDEYHATRMMWNQDGLLIEDLNLNREFQRYEQFSKVRYAGENNVLEQRIIKQPNYPLEVFKLRTMPNTIGYMYEFQDIDHWKQCPCSEVNILFKKK